MNEIGGRLRQYPRPASEDIPEVLIPEYFAYNFLFFTLLPGILSIHNKNR